MILTPDQLPISEYHGAQGAPRWLSKTSIRDFMERGPKWWRRAYIDRRLIRKRPDGAIQGLALDCYLTEGQESFARTFAIKPEGMKLSTREGKEWAQEHEGKEILSWEDGLILMDAVDAVRTCCVWSDMEKALPQRTIRRDSPSLGLGLQARPDFIREDYTVEWDLKKCFDLDRFPGQAFDLAYHTQAAICGWCLAGYGIPLEHAYLVAVEWERCARCRVLEIPQEMLVHGDHQMRLAAAEIAACIQTNDWTDTQDKPQMLEVPAWAQRKIEKDHG